MQYCKHTAKAFVISSVPIDCLRIQPARIGFKLQIVTAGNWTDVKWRIRIDVTVGHW